VGRWEQARRAAHSSRTCVLSRFLCLQVSLLAMYGSKDPLMKQADYLLKLFSHAEKVRAREERLAVRTHHPSLYISIPTSHSLQVIIEDAGHACYLDKPDEAQKALSKFVLENIHAPIPVLFEQQEDE
jgi:hypothetical protein